ncbi:MAG: hypothetical protein ACRCZD_20330 [Phycicoccus sp.]
MSSTTVLLKVAGAEVRHLLRRLAREALGDRVSARTSGWVAAAGLTALTIFLAMRAVQTGGEIGSGFGPGLVATLFTGSAVALGMTAVIGMQMWSRSARAESERLAILPLGRPSLAALGAVASVVPSLLGLWVTLPSIVAIAMTTRIPPTTALGAFTLGLAMPLALAAFWTIPMVLLRPRRDLVVVGLVALSLVAALAHALWQASQDAGAPSWARFNPVLWVLTNADEYSSVTALLSVAALALSVVVLVVLRRIRIRQTPRELPWELPTGLTSRLPIRVRLQLALVRIVWRRSSLVSELGVAIVLSTVICAVASVLLGQARLAHGYTALLIAAAFAALPLLGVPGTLVPVSTLVQLGMRPRDIRAGLVGAAALFHTSSLVPGAAVLIWRGAQPVHLGVWCALVAVTFGIALGVGVVLRRITSTSLGRSAAVATAMPPFFGVVMIGLPTWPAAAITATAAGVGVVLVSVLTASIRQRSVA